MIDFSHLNALEDRRHREEMRLAVASTKREKEFRQREIESVNKEIAGERKFLGLAEEAAPIEFSDDELLSELLLK